MDKIANIAADKLGDMVKDKVLSVFGIEDEDEDDKKGGFFSLFGGGDKKKNEDEDEEREKGGLFSFGDDKKKDEDKGGFFSKIFDKDDDDDGKEKKSGFKGLFSEQQGAIEWNEGQTGGGGEERTGGVSEGDLFSDLMDVAEETSRGE